MSIVIFTKFASTNTKSREYCTHRRTKCSRESMCVIEYVLLPESSAYVAISYHLYVNHPVNLIIHLNFLKFKSALHGFRYENHPHNEIATATPIS